MKHFRILLLAMTLYSLSFCNVTFADSRTGASASDSSIVVQYTDSLSSYADSLYNSSSSLSQSIAKTAASRNNRYYRLFTPLTFYHGVAANHLGYNFGDSSYDDVDEQVDNTLLNFYLKYPWLVSDTESKINSAGTIPESIQEPITSTIALTDATAPVPEEVDITPVDIVVKKPNFWKISGDYNLQIIQSYISGNWYKGGESNYSMLGAVTMQANYDNKSKLKFDNKLELKLGFRSSESDSIHKYKTSEDLIRYTGKLGLQATKRWYYTLQLTAYTQFHRGYKSNDLTVYSDFMSPFNLNLSLGMDYKVESKNKKLTGTVNISPLAYNMRYVSRLALATRYSLEEGHHTLHEFGSDFTVDLTWKFTDDISWKTRLYGYTSYKRAELEWENTFSFKVNKYIATTLFIYPRFDDGGSRDADRGYWQLKEYASMGFSYSF